MSRTHVTCIVNGDEVDFLTEDSESLLHALRDEVGLTGAKEGCSTGDCGACTVVLNGRIACSCLVFAPEAQGATIDLLAEVDTASAPPDEADEGLAVDPHIWLDPGLFATAIPPLVDAMESAAPDEACDFRANGAALIEELGGFDAEFVAGLADCGVTTLVTNHAAFGYLAAAYGLTQAAISGLAPDTEPTPERIAELVDLVHRDGVTTVFSEALVSTEVAQTLADEAGVQVAVLDTLEGLTPDEEDAGQDYGSVMRRNLETLRGGLDCR